MLEVRAVMTGLHWSRGLVQFGEGQDDDLPDRERAVRSLPLAVLFAIYIAHGCGLYSCIESSDLYESTDERFSENCKLRQIPGSKHFRTPSVFGVYARPISPRLMHGAWLPSHRPIQRTLPPTCQWETLPVHWTGCDYPHPRHGASRTLFMQLFLHDR